MDRRRAASGAQGLSRGDALQKLKRELSDVLETLRTARDGKAGGAGGGGVSSPFYESEDGGVGGEGESQEVAFAKKPSMRISTAIPFDYWSLALLVVAVLLLLLSQVPFLIPDNLLNGATIALSLIHMNESPVV